MNITGSGLIIDIADIEMMVLVLADSGPPTLEHTIGESSFAIAQRLNLYSGDLVGVPIVIAYTSPVNWTVFANGWAADFQFYIDYDLECPEQRTRANDPARFVNWGVVRNALFYGDPDLYQTHVTAFRLAHYDDVPETRVSSKVGFLRADRWARA